MEAINKFKIHIPWALLTNFGILLFLYAICRIVFISINYGNLTEELTLRTICRLFYGGLMFDISAICYTNILYVILVFIPFPQKENNSYRNGIRGVFLFTNALCLIINLMDSVYYVYTQHRATAIIFNEFKAEDNQFGILGIELIDHWYLVLVAVIQIIILSKLYRNYVIDVVIPVRYYANQVVWLLVSAFLLVSGIRGSFPDTSTRPISMNDAYLYANNSIEASFVINTPFAIIRTIGEKPMEVPSYFDNIAKMEELYSPIHYPKDSAMVKKKNIVILIVESFGQEYVGSLNKNLDNGEYKGYTTFVDSLLQQSLTWEKTFSNSGFTIDAMPSILASIPRMDKPFVLTPFSLNNITSIAKELGNWGYETAFFHGAKRASLGLQAFANNIGFKRGYSKEDYCEDKRFGGEKDFDGTWAIWDEPFLQFYCTKMNEMKEPFLTSVFTASSHHPFAIPKEYQDVFPDEGLYAMHKCVRYTDHAIKQFFATASKQPWFKNTLFVITADHSLKQFTHDEYKTELGTFRIPIFIFDPSGELPKGVQPGIAQQIDLMPTLMHYLGYPYPFFAFGKDLFHLEQGYHWAMNWDHLPQYIHDDYVLQFDGKNITAVYNYIKDPLLKTNLKGKTKIEKEMELKLKAFIQTYMERMKNNDVTY